MHLFIVFPSTNIMDTQNKSLDALTKEKSAEKNQSDFSLWKAISMSFAQIADVSAYQSFIFLVFTFYYTLVIKNVNYITVGFIIWSIWNMVNDPIMGFLSDRRQGKLGRRKPWMLIAFIPLAAIMILLFTPPLQGSITLQFIYFLFIICVFELFYTMYSLNQVSLFPEVFLKSENRYKANNIKQIASIIGLLCAFLLPSFIIGDFTNEDNMPKYITLGIIVASIIIVFSVLFFIWGPKERPEFKMDAKSNPSFKESLKITLKNKNFMRYIPTEIASWFVFGMLPTILPLYGRYVLEIPEDSPILGILMGFSFVSAALFMPFWAWVVNRLGVRKSWIISQGVWILTLSPLMFIKGTVLSVITFILMGCGMAGTLFFIDLAVSDIVDADEVETGVRREAAYYGVNAFFCRMSNILVILSINLVFNLVGWGEYVGWGDLTVEQIGEKIIGLRILMFVFPAVALLVGIIGMYNYPLHGKNLSEMKVKLAHLHDQKEKKII